MTAEQAWKRIEPALRCPPVALDRFQKVIRKRFVKSKYGSFRIPEYEDILSQDKYYILKYARNITLGRVPQKMHRILLASAIADSNDRLLKEYFEVCEGKRHYVRLF